MTNSLNQYTSNGSTSFGYDSKGNLHTSGSNYYCYNSENRLTSVGTSSNCSATASLTYDPSERLSKVTGTSTSQFAYDGLNVIAEYDGSATPALKAKYVFGPEADEAIVQYDSSGNRTYLNSDERGSIVALTNDAGTVMGIDTYDEYGMTPLSNWSTERFQYTGQMYVPEVGLYYYKNRIYSPTLGRFLETDPVGYADGPNWYAYVQNDSVNGSDPLGLCIGGGGSTSVDPQTNGPVISCPKLSGDGGWLDDSLFEDFSTNISDGPFGHDYVPPWLRNLPTLKDLRTDLCKAGNLQEHGAEDMSTLALGLLGGGVAVGGVGIMAGNEDVADSGAALVGAAGAAGIGAGAVQVLGGVDQGISEGDWHNVIAGGSSLLEGAVLSRALATTIPRGWHGESLFAAQSHNRYAGIITSGLISAANWFKPKQVSCGQ